MKEGKAGLVLASPAPTTVADEIHNLIHEAKRQGWRVRQGKHWILYSPDGSGIVVIGLTPSDHRTVQNVKSMLKKHGFRC